jgi:hypothetical protein
MQTLLKWEQEVYNNIEKKQEAVVTIKQVHPFLEINDFLGDVGIIDKQELGSPKVCPEHREGEHELTQIMKVILIYKRKMAFIL